MCWSRQGSSEVSVLVLSSCGVTALQGSSDVMHVIGLRMGEPEMALGCPGGPEVITGQEKGRAPKQRPQGPTWAEDGWRPLQKLHEAGIRSAPAPRGACPYPVISPVRTQGCRGVKVCGFEPHVSPLLLWLQKAHTPSEVGAGAGTRDFDPCLCQREAGGQCPGPVTHRWVSLRGGAASSLP